MQMVEKSKKGARETSPRDVGRVIFAFSSFLVVGSRALCISTTVQLFSRDVRCPPETASINTDEIGVVVTAAPQFRTSFLFTNEPLFRAL